MGIFSIEQKFADHTLVNSYIDIFNTHFLKYWYFRTCDSTLLLIPDMVSRRTLRVVKCVCVMAPLSQQTAQTSCVHCTAHMGL